MATGMKPRSRAKKRILIVDGHPMMRQGLAQLINHEPDRAVCGEADSAATALKRIIADRPDLVLADISLPDRSGLELIKDVRALHPGLPVLVFSMQDELLYAKRVLRAGGRGYVMKQEGGQTLMQAIRVVLDGRIYVSEKMSARILEWFSGEETDTSQSPVEGLTDREFEVFQLAGHGLRNREIAERLHLSVKTVEVHRLNIRHKLKLKRAADMVRYAIRWTEVQNPA